MLCAEEKENENRVRVQVYLHGELMKKILPILLVVVMVAGVIGLYLYQNYDPYRNLPQVSLDRLNTQEADWYAEGIFDYQIEVLIKFSSEQRIYRIAVVNNAISEAFSSRYDEDARDWLAYMPVSTEEADFFTVPGMFRLLRADLLNEDVEREVRRMGLREGQSYPGLIYLGNIIQEGIVMEGTDLVVEVLSVSETP